MRQTFAGEGLAGEERRNWCRQKKMRRRRESRSLNKCPRLGDAAVNPRRSWVARRFCRKRAHQKKGAVPNKPKKGTVIILGAAKVEEEERPETLFESKATMETEVRVGWPVWIYLRCVTCA